MAAFIHHHHRHHHHRHHRLHCGRHWASSEVAFYMCTSKYKLFALRLTTLAVSLGILCAACQRGKFSDWEGSLFGPYQGEIHNGVITTPPDSNLRVTPQFVLEIHSGNSTGDPILCLRDNNGIFIWSRDLVTRREGQKNIDGQIQQIKLVDLDVDGTGFKVEIRFNWGSPNSQAVGIVYLDRGCSFRYFALGSP